MKLQVLVNDFDTATRNTFFNIVESDFFVIMSVSMLYLFQHMAYIMAFQEPF